MRSLSNLLKRDKISKDSNQIIYPWKELQEKKTAVPKQESAVQEIQDVTKTNLEQINAEAKRILTEAKQKAEDIVNKAERKAKKMLELASKKGFHEGYQEGLDKAKKECQIGLSDIASFMKRLDEGQAKFYSDLEGQTIDLALKIAEKVVSKKFEDDKEIFLSLYEKAIKDLNNPKWIKLTVDKSQAQFVTTNSEYLLSMVSEAERIEVVVDDDAPKGTCVVETSDKIVDASVYTQIELLKNAIINAK